jgi:hypothetical protein
MKEHELVALRSHHDPKMRCFAKEYDDIARLLSQMCCTLGNDNCNIERDPQLRDLLLNMELAVSGALLKLYPLDLTPV